LVPPLDIFRAAADGQLIWKATPDSLSTAERRVKILMAPEPSDCLIYSQETGHKILVRSKTNDPRPPPFPD
jgi:hypothetical protein